MKIEEYIKLRKKYEGFDETEYKNKEDNIRKLIEYIFDFYKILEDDQSSQKNLQLKELRRKVNYQYEIDSFSEDTQRWLIKLFNQYNVKVNRKLSIVLDDTDYFLLISDEKDLEKLSYSLFAEVVRKQAYLSEYPLEILSFAKDYYGIYSKNTSLSSFKYQISLKSKKFIKDVHNEYGINLVAWAKSYLNYFYSRVTLWPVSHRIETEEDGKRIVQYNMNANRNVFALNVVLEKLSDSNGVSSLLKKNKKILVELLREESRQLEITRK
ncbi:MAG: hypothetical protein VB121_12890 [Enterococcus thailandicus]|nr:hypothetical protein [Enterococcus thailandicus]